MVDDQGFERVTKVLVNSNVLVVPVGLL